MFDGPVENLWKTVENFLPVENPSQLNFFCLWKTFSMIANMRNLHQKQKSGQVDESCYTEDIIMARNLLLNKRIACLDIHSPSCLRSAYDKSYSGGIADMYPLVDAAAEAGISLIEFTPVQDTTNPSPYMGLSIFSFNPIYLDTRRLGGESGLGNSRLGLIDQRKCLKHKLSVLRSLYEKVGFGDKKFDDYDRNVLAYALFKVLKRKFKRTWVNWPGIFSTGEVRRILAKHPVLHDRVKFELFVQDTMAGQWMDLSDYGRQKGVYFVMDKPIYPIYDSAEVWANQNIFYLNPDGTLSHESGCDNPKDPFGPQRWGHAVYRFKERQGEVIAYYLETIRHLSKISSVIRVDHALALVWKYYLIEKKSGRARHVEALKDRILSAIKNEFPDIIFIAEDLGYSSKAIDRLLNKFEISGIRCPQWVNRVRYSRISEYPQLSMSATSTHDTDTLAAWWKKLPHDERRIYFKKMKGITRKKARRKKIRIPLDQMTKEMISLVFCSHSQIASVSLADLTGDMRRYNKPGEKNRTNWKVRCRVPTNEIDFSFLKEIIKQTGRLQGRN